MTKTIAVVLAVLSVLAFIGTTVVTVAVMTSAVATPVAADGNCGGPSQPPCECLIANPPDYCKNPT